MKRIIHAVVVIEGINISSPPLVKIKFLKYQVFVYVVFLIRQFKTNHVQIQKSTQYADISTHFEIESEAP